LWKQNKRPILFRFFVTVNILADAKASLDAKGSLDGQNFCYRYDFVFQIFQ
jgi:hypothetical protein